MRELKAVLEVRSIKGLQNVGLSGLNVLADTMADIVWPSFGYFVDLFGHKLQNQCSEPVCAEVKCAAKSWNTLVSM